VRAERWRGHLSGFAHRPNGLWSAPAALHWGGRKWGGSRALTIRSGAATSSAVGSLRPGDPQISWPPPIVSFDMPKTPGCSSEQIGVVRPALLRSADIEHFCDLTTILVCSTVIQTT